MNKFKRLRYRFIFKVNFQKGKMKSSPFWYLDTHHQGGKWLALSALQAVVMGAHIPPLEDRPKSIQFRRTVQTKTEAASVQKQPPSYYLRRSACSGAISLYPFPWMLMISIDGSSFKCLRNLVIYTSILLALK